MKFTVSKKNLLDSLALCVPVSNPRSTHPSHTYLFLQVDGSTVTMTCHNDKAMVKVQAEGGLENGNVAISAAKVIPLVKQFPDGPIEFAEHRGSVVLSSPSTTLKYKLPVAAIDPPVEAPGGTRTRFDVPAKTLLLVIEAVAHSVDPGTKVPGLRLEFRRDRVVGAAMNAHQAAMCTIKGAFQHYDAMLPVDAVNAIRRLPPKEGTYTVDADLATFRIIGQGVEYSCAMLPDNFPDLLQVKPKTSAEHAVMVPREPFIGALKSVQQVCTDLNPGVILSFDEGAVFIKSESDMGGGGIEVPVEYQGKRPEFVCSPRYLIDATASIPTGDLVMSYVDSMSPVLVEPLGDHGGVDTWCVVMPMRAM